MGYDIENKRGDYFRASINVWPMLLHIGNANGWVPMGTRLDIEGWTGEYTSNGGQVITAEDGESLAAAMRLGLQSENGIAEALAFGPCELQLMLEKVAGCGVIGLQIDENAIKLKMTQAAEFFTGGDARIS